MNIGIRKYSESHTDKFIFVSPKWQRFACTLPGPMHCTAPETFRPGEMDRQQHSSFKEWNQALEYLQSIGQTICGDCGSVSPCACDED